MPSFWIEIACLFIGVSFYDSASIWEYAASNIRRRMGKELGIMWNNVLMEIFQVPNKYLPEDTEENYANVIVTSRLKKSSFTVRILVESLCEFLHKYKCVTNAVDFKVCTNWQRFRVNVSHKKCIYLSKMIFLN